MFQIPVKNAIARDANGALESRLPIAPTPFLANAIGHGLQQNRVGVGWRGGLEFPDEEFEHGGIAGFEMARFERSPKAANHSTNRPNKVEADGVGRRKNLLEGDRREASEFRLKGGVGQDTDSLSIQKGKREWTVIDEADPIPVVIHGALGGVMISLRSSWTWAFHRSSYPATR